MSNNNLSFFAPAPLNMEDLLEKEIKSCGGEIKRIHRTGIGFSGTLETGYRLCLWSRIASRILIPFYELESEGPDDLYKKAVKFPWQDYIKPDASFAIDSATRGSSFTDNRFTSLKLKDAIVDSFRKKTGDRPEIDPESPDIRLNLNVRDKQVVISIDLAGDGLHKRGYRSATGPAPLKENAAAAMLMRAGWETIAEAGGSLLDPMCGSGTLLIEGAMMAGDIAPGLYHKNYGFNGWTGHDEKLWKVLLGEAERRKAKGAKQLPPIRGFDKDPVVVAAAWENIRNAGLERWIHVEKQDLINLKPTAAMEKPGLIAVNPPYGKRLEENALLSPLYRLFGDKLKENFPGWKAVMITSSEELAKEVGLKPDKSNTIYNGPLECVLNRYTLFSKQERQTFTERVKTLSPGAEMFANRLIKNLKQRRKWAKKSGVTSYRLYDADMPEYSAAVDLYEGTWAHVQEYAPPHGKVDPNKVLKRRKEMIDGLPAALGLPKKDIFFKTREKKRGSDQYSRLSEKGEKVIIREGGLNFLVNFTDYLDTGIFLDHRITRNLIRERAGGKTFLNLFAYTGSATVYAADGGAATTTTVDASGTYLGWAEENMGVNGFTKEADYRKKHRFIKADCLKWIEETKEKWDLIFLDPPTFSNSKSREETFDIQTGHVKLLTTTLALLNPGGTLIFSNNYRKFRLDLSYFENWDFTELTEKTVPEDFTRRKSIHRCWEIKKAGKNEK
ncbi:MAG: bifunctional 23S rRNA (guanine(2069)-N(7))-methyltransferase RlmK/23S rRNA (guanine(2445)-N(2))-methyltransferase RlmL [Spirochaetales bacterium]|nr:bifunctional 23S rRNA (guanine(2069)-N(7))-methyltransferase RlmK/23S rRNA (guanine(2445)-N(2))-methyltransferase RlmL [Spirochaetales bacterium]